MVFKYTYPATVVLAGVLVGCTSESFQPSEAGNPSLNHAPTMRSVEILPRTIALDQQISVRAEAFDPDADLITYRYRWRVNGTISPGETHSSFSAKTLKRGDRLSVEVTPYDGSIEGTPVVADAVVANAAPQVTQLLLEPLEVRAGDRVHVEVTGSDLDEDPIEYRFRWWRNNSEVADGNVSELDTHEFAKGDTIVVEVTPSDPISKGKSKISTPITILNSAPKIMTVPPNTIERGRFIYVVRADDPDGDRLTYALEASPPGMKIDKMTGRIEWPLTGKLVGNHKVRVTATDNEQAKAFQEFDVTFSVPSSAPRMTIPKTFRINTRLVTPFPALLE